MKRIEHVLFALAESDWSTATELAQRCDLPRRFAKEAVRYAVKTGLAGMINCGYECIYWIEPAGVAKLLAVLNRSPQQLAEIEAARLRRQRYRDQALEQAWRPGACGNVLAGHLGAVWR